MSTLVSPNRLAEIAALIGDPARAGIMLALMGGTALSAGELARAAGISAATASGHLARLMAADLLTLRSQGRHRYYALAAPEVAQLIEAMALMAPGDRRAPVPGPRDARLRYARRCYDHLAGTLGVRLADRMVAQEHVRLGDGVAVLTDSGRRFICAMGLEPETAGSRRLCRACLDWSERRFHLGGWLGAALLTHALHEGWLKGEEGRTLTLTPKGRAAFAAHLGLEV